VHSGSSGRSNPLDLGYSNALPSSSFAVYARDSGLQSIFGVPLVPLQTGKEEVSIIGKFVGLY
jgi:hypothetical protein